MYEDFHQKRQLAKIVDMAKVKANLPIAAEMDAIVASVRAHPVTLIAGDTGCGKSTQVPQYLIRAGFARACTQPRRVAAVALARRVAREMLTERGDDIAHQIRFDSTVSRATKCAFLTEGTRRKTRRRPGPRRLPRRRHRRRGARASRGRRPPPRTPSRRPRAKALLSTRHHVRHDEPRTVRAVFRRMPRRRGSPAERSRWRLCMSHPASRADLRDRRGRRREAPVADSIVSTPSRTSRCYGASTRNIPATNAATFDFFTRRGGAAVPSVADAIRTYASSDPSRPLDRPPAARRSRRDGTGPRVRRRAGRCAKGDPLDQRRRGRPSRWTAFASSPIPDGTRRCAPPVAASRAVEPSRRWISRRVRGSAQRSRGSRRSRRVFPDVLARDVRRDVTARRRRLRFRESISTRRFSA